jgi:putative Holliday junction resolvase
LCYNFSRWQIIERGSILKLLGLDVGEKKIGVAITDEEQKIAFPWQTIERTSLSTDFRWLQKILEEEKIEKIVVGVPLNLKGEETLQTHKVKIFLTRLRKKIALPVLEWEERLTTKQAIRYFQEARMKKKKYKKKLDKLSAAIILQSYLDQQRRG